jgi:hypothetical protein
MNMPLEEFCPEIDSFDDDVRSAKAASPVTTSVSKSYVLDSTTKLASDLSAAASSPLVPVCAVDNNNVNLLPNCLQAPVSGMVPETIYGSEPSPNHSEASAVVAVTVCESGPSPNHSKASEVTDDKLIKSEPGKADQPTIAIVAQHSLTSFVIDLTEENEEQSTPDRPEPREADQPTVVIPAQHSSGSVVIDLTEEGNKKSKTLQETQQVEPRYSSSKFQNKSS